MKRILTLIAAVVILTTSLFAAAPAFATPTVPVLVGGIAHSSTSGQPVEIAVIAPPGTSFAGTLTTRTSFYGVDSVFSIYTDKRSRLWVSKEASNEPAVTAIRIDDNNYRIELNGGVLGCIAFTPTTGALTLSTARSWFQGSVQGTYNKYP